VEEFEMIEAFKAYAASLGVAGYVAPTAFDADESGDRNDARRLEPGVYIVKRGGDVEDASDKWGFGYAAAQHLRFIALEHVGIAVGDFAIEEPGTYIVEESDGFSRAFTAREFTDLDTARESLRGKAGYPIWDYVRQEFI
jgi:hypothetical protein